MAEDFQPSYWWNNSASAGGFDRRSQPIPSPPSSSLSPSTATPDAAGAASSFRWPPPTTEITESKPTILFDSQIDSSHTPGFNTWSQTLPGKTECSSFHSLLQDHDPSTRPLSRLELGEASSTIPFKDGNSSSSPSSSSSNMYSSSILQGLVEQSSGFQRPCLDNQRKTAHVCYQSDQMMDFHGVLINETQQPLWKQFGDANYNPLWSNASAGGFYPSPLPPSRTQISEPSSGCRKTAMGLGGDWEERASTAPEKKKTRIEAPSEMPAITLQVMRKENLRDRITALQQLVSPFGKTDTASVLQEAIEYIKFLHDQVSVLCAPYFKTGRPMQQNQNSDNICAKAKAGEERRADVLRSRGLCLVPMENIYPADGESITTTSEFWTPIHGRTYW